MTENLHRLHLSDTTLSVHFSLLNEQQHKVKRFCVVMLWFSQGSFFIPKFFTPHMKLF